jgi:hypothetical protein
MTEDQMADFNRIANAVSFKVSDVIIDAAEASDAGVLGASSVFFAVVNGAVTGALRTLHATAGALQLDREALFETLMRQMADSWGQTRGERPQQWGTIQ